jgi:hypothetical protein
MDAVVSDRILHDKFTVYVPQGSLFRGENIISKESA